MTNYNPVLLLDFYKTSHRSQYPEGTENVYSTWTPRQSLIPGVNAVVAFSFQKFIKEYLIYYFNQNFFYQPKVTVIEDYKEFIKSTLGEKNPETKHLEDLHDLGYLPLSIYAVPEGTLVPIRVPMLTIENTDKRFFWLTNYIETIFSCEVWQGCTSATIANEYRKMGDNYAKETGGELSFVPLQFHDFSMRGMSSMYSAVNSGMGHLLSSVGTDTVPAILGVKKYYNGDYTKELIGTSIPASEHSVACANGMDESATLIRFLTEIYPTGFVSFVSDTWDFWNLVGNILPSLKETIMKRDGKLVIRPDSGDPVKIICGDSESDNEFAKKGLIECLWDIFGGSYNGKGYKVLNSHIGAIYGDSITLKRANEIFSKLKNEGFCSTNIVFGVGSFTYQYNTRDTFGFAIKSTSVTINGDEIQIFKSPKTDSGVKKSQKGRVSVYMGDDGNITFKDGFNKNDVMEGNLLREIFLNGKLLIDEDFTTIRNRLEKQRRNN